MAAIKALPARPRRLEGAVVLATVVLVGLEDRAAMAVLIQPQRPRQNPDASPISKIKRR